MNGIQQIFGVLKKNVLRCLWCSCSAYLKEYKNEDVAVGAWMLGLDTEHVDNQNLCCGANNGLFLNLPFFGTARVLSPEGQLGYNCLCLQAKSTAFLIIAV